MKLFLNDKYYLLEYLYNNKIKLYKDYIVIINQDEIAKKLHFGKSKVNKTIKELLEFGYLDSNYKVKGSYKLTNKSINLFGIVKKIGDKLDDKI